MPFIHFPKLQQSTLNGSMVSFMGDWVFAPSPPTQEQHNGIGLIVCLFAICAMEFDRLMLADAHQQSKQLQKGFKGLSGARRECVCVG